MGGVNEGGREWSLSALAGCGTTIFTASGCMPTPCLPIPPPRPPPDASRHPSDTCRHLPQQQHILQLGVGTSRLQEDMADDGYAKITSIDYSPVAIQRLQQTYPARPQLAYAVADARSMPQYQDGSFGGVLVRTSVCVCVPSRGPGRG